MTAAGGAESRIECRQCSGDALDKLGAIPLARLFAGQLLDPPWNGGSLYLCRRCHLGFRHPIRSEAEYERLYERAAETVWVSSELRADQRLVLSAIESACATAGKVLDVGCYDGSLLARLGPRFSKYGVEASAAAARKAEHNGVEIVGTRIRDLESVTGRFEVVCAVDVIEHVSHPRAFIASLAGRLSDGGTLIISTGNMETPAWRWAGGRYWYCGFPEHLSFISPAWAHAAAAKLNLEVVGLHRFAYGDVGGSVSRLRRRCSYYRKLGQVKLSDAVRARLPRAFASGACERSHGRPGLFADHVMIILRHRVVQQHSTAMPSEPAVPPPSSPKIDSRMNGT